MHIAIHMPTRPQPQPIPNSQPPPTANTHENATFTVTGVRTSPSAMRARTITMFRLRPIPKNTSTSMICRPSSCTTGSAVSRPTTASKFHHSVSDTAVVSTAAMRSAIHTRRRTMSNLPAPNR